MCVVCAAQMRYNTFLLALLTFVAKCVGLEALDLEEIVEQHGVSLVVFGTPSVPSKVTEEQVAALGGLEAEGEPQAARGGEGRGKSVRQRAAPQLASPAVAGKGAGKAAAEKAQPDEAAAAVAGEDAVEAPAAAGASEPAAT